MKKILLSLALVFTLAPAAGACSVKAGYVAKGLIVTPAGMRQECGALYNAFRKPALNSGSASWAELYEVSPARIGEAGKKIQAALQKAGYVQLMSKEVDNGHQFGFGNVKNKKVVILNIMTIADTLFLGILGN